MRVLVAGGSGFIGSHLSRALVVRGHHVICVDDLSTGSLHNVADLIESERFELIECDVAATPSLSVDVIAHLASPASPVDYERMPLHTLRANALGSFRLLEIARMSAASFLFVSTSEIYGDPLVHPQPETYWGNVDPIGPRSCYDEAKRFGEALLFATRRETGIRANVVRLFNTYGPAMRRDDGRVIPEMISAALAGRPLVVHGNGMQTRSFCYVSDLVEGLLHVLLDPALDGEVLNIGNPHEITMRDLARHITELTESDGELRFTSARPGDPERRRPVIDRLQARYGWEPRVQLREGLRTTIHAFRIAEAASRERTAGGVLAGVAAGDPGDRRDVTGSLARVAVRPQ
jgi:nucleoside-diphosphate-sugar epimerase